MVSSIEPDEEELAVKERLIALVDGAAAEPAPSADPAPEPGPRAWWSHRPWAKTPDEEQADEEEPADEKPQEDSPRPFQPQPDYWPQPHMPAVVHRTRDRAEAAISPGTRRLLYNASAAGAGWMLGLYSKFAWALDDCGRQSISGALVLGVGGSTLIAHLWDRRTRHWWPGIAWCARIPLATALLALALWAPAA